MDFYDILLAKKLNGEGGGDSTGIIVTEEILPNGGIVKHIEGQVISGTKQISNNGEFDVSAYKSVNVNVSGGGSSLDLHPKVTMNVTVEGNSTYMVNNALVVDDGWVVIQGNNVVTQEEDLDADNIVNFNDGETKEVAYVLPLDTDSYGVYNLIPNTGYLQDITFANCVNCISYQGALEITDHTQDASADVTLTFTHDD